MPEVLAQFSEPVLSKDRTSYRAQACGALASDGLWEGWIEFVPVAGGTPVRSPRETTQPNRVDALYWATGLTATYLEGALERALYRPILKAPPPAEPVFQTPAPDFDAEPRRK